MKNRNKGMGKKIWQGIRYLRRDNRLYDDTFINGQEWWDIWNEQQYRKYSYRWVCEWINQHPNADVWNELFQADPYLKMLCERHKVSLYDQLLYYGEEWCSKR